MVYSGHMKQGLVVLDQPVVLPDGLRVRVEVPENAIQSPRAEAGEEAADKRLLKYVGKAVGLPPDAARNHDHYLYGTAKR